MQEQEIELVEVRKQNVRAVVSLLVANAVMTTSQTNIASLFYPISLDFHLSVTDLGILTSVFFIGYATFEIVSGVLAPKLGPRKLIMVGSGLVIASSFASVVAPSFQILVVARVVAGIGFGLFFPPTLALIVKYSKSGSAGVALALATASYSVGAAVGVSAFATLGLAIGWRGSFLVCGVPILLLTMSVKMLVPPDRFAEKNEVSATQLRLIFSNRSLLAVALALGGGAATAGLTGNFLVYYLEEILNVNSLVAGVIGGLTYAAPLFTSVLSGRLFDRGVSPKILLMVSAIVMTLGTSILFIQSVTVSIIAAILSGFAVGVYGTIAFAYARSLSPAPEYESLHIGIVDSSSLVGLFVSPLYFSITAARYGYSMAWLLGGLVAVAFVLPMLTLKQLHRR